MALFVDRQDAGRRLGNALADWRFRDAVVLGIPRGGMCVALEVAQVLGVPLGCVLVGKLGAPRNPHYSIGAVCLDGDVTVDTEKLRWQALSGDQLQMSAEVTRRELLRRQFVFGAPDLRQIAADRPAIIVDDGLESEHLAKAAVAYARRSGANHVVIAAPCGARDVVRTLSVVADAVVVLQQPASLVAVGQAYGSYCQVTDGDVTRILDSHRPSGASLAGAGASSVPQALRWSLLSNRVSDII